MKPRESASAAASLDSGSGHDLVIGQRLAFAAASITLGVCSFVSLLGMEKSALAIIFGVMALRRPATGLAGRGRLARLGIALGVLQIVMIAVLLILFWPHVMRFFEFLERFDAQGAKP